jgi:hypothetical protein
MNFPSPRLCAAIVFSAFTGFLAAPAQAQILGYDVNFNSGSTSLSGNFLGANDNALAGGYAWGATAGTGGTGGLAVTQTGGNNFFYRPNPPALDSTSTFDFSSLAAGTTIVSTTDFLWSNSTATDLTVLTAGFTPNNTSTTALSSTGALAGSLIRNGSSNVTLRMRNGTGDASTLSFAQSTLTAGNWYQLSYEVTKSATTNTFDYTVSLYSIGAAGTSVPVLFNDGTKDITISGSLTNSSIYADSSVFFAYDIRNTAGNTGIRAADNFDVAVVPEPVAGTLVLTGLFGLTALRRRRA